jgi:hypothetical protein
MAQTVPAFQRDAFQTDAFQVETILSAVYADNNTAAFLATGSAVNNTAAFYVEKN